MAKEGSKSCQIIIPQNQLGRKSGIFPYPFKYLGSFHTTLEEFEKFAFTLKTHQMYPVHTAQEFENTNNHWPFWICVWQKKLGR